MSRRCTKIVPHAMLLKVLQASRVEHGTVHVFTHSTYRLNTCGVTVDGPRLQSAASTFG